MRRFVTQLAFCLWVGAAACSSPKFNESLDDALSNTVVVAATDAGEQSIAPKESPCEPCETLNASSCLSEGRAKVCVSLMGKQCWSEQYCPLYQSCLKGACTATCSDECLLGQRSEGKECTLWNVQTRTSTSLGEGMHDRARSYDVWNRNWLSPLGQPSWAYFTDGSLTQLDRYDGTECALWGGVALAAHAFRFEATNAPDAVTRMNELSDALERLWSVSGDPGYLARCAFPSNSPYAISSQFQPNTDASPPFHHMNRSFRGEKWNWMGHVSRDMYAGVLFGLAQAFEHLDGTRQKQLATHLLQFVSELSKTRSVRAVFSDGVSVPFRTNYLITTDDEPQYIDFRPLPNGEPDVRGLQEFLPVWPRSISRPASSLLLGAAFTMALKYSEPYSDLAATRASVKTFYEAHVSNWMSIAEGWSYTSVCGNDYYGVHINFLNVNSWLEVESDPKRKERLRRLLTEKMWKAVDDHKNVFFALLYAPHASEGYDKTAAVAMANEQLSQFHAAPSTHRPVQNNFLENPLCENNALSAIDIRFRRSEDYLWQRHPWWLRDSEDTPNRVYPGVDYLIAYWAGRKQGAFTDERPHVCTRWVTSN